VTQATSEGTAYVIRAPEADLVTLRGTMQGIPGLAPLLRDLPTGCAFHPRCARAEARCSIEKPDVRDLAADHRVACHLA